MLGPHHLNYNDYLTRTWIQEQISNYVPYSWGVRELEWNAIALQSGSLELLKFRAVFPDGTLIHIPGNAKCDPLFIDMEGLNDSSEISIVIDLNTPLNQPIDEPIDDSRIESHYIPLDSGGKTSIALHTIIYSLRLFVSSDKQSMDSKLMSKARLVLGKFQSHQSSLSPVPFSPPVIDCRASAELISLIHKFSSFVSLYINRLEAKSLFINDRNCELLAILGKLHWLLNIKLLHVNIHPFALFCTLMKRYIEINSLVNLKALSSEDMMQIRYDHNNLYDTINHVVNKIKNVVESVYVKPILIQKLRFDGSYFVSRVNPAIISSCKNLCIMTSGIEFDIAAIAKISCREELPLLLAKSIPGLPILNENRREKTDPNAKILTSKNYYRIDKSGEHWRLILKYKNIAVFIPGANSNYQLSLVELGV